MNLVLRALTLNGQPLSQAIVGRFDTKGGTIGRSDTNTMALPDPERHISRLQAEVIAQDGRFNVRNAASANAIFVNGRALGPGESGVLADHDELRIGGYVLGAMIDADNQAARTIMHGRAVVDAHSVIVNSAAEHRTDPRLMARATDPRAPAARPAAPARPPPASAASNPFGDLFAPAPVATAAAADAASGPFADLLGNGPPAGLGAASTVDPFAFLSPAPPPRAASPVAPAGSAIAPPVGTPVRLPDDFDPFADLAPAPPKASTPTAGLRVGASDLLGSVGAGSGTPASIDTVFGLGPPSSGGADPLAAFLNPPASRSGGVAAGPGATSSDPFAMFGAAPARASTPAAHAAFDHTPELKAAYRPPQVAAPAELPASAPAPVAPPRPDAHEDAETTPAFRALVAPGSTPVVGPNADPLWAAFCEGAGIGVSLPQGLNVEQMRTLGKIMYEAIEGTLRLMAVRAAAKTELRAAVTTIRARNNNPLKFSPNAQVALEQLLQPPLRGFMAGPPAMQDAMHDLLGHSIGTMAGMRAALAGVLNRFEPGALERKLVGSSMLDSVLPMNRKAKLWDLYLQHFGSIREEAQEDFDQLFGAAFVAAYEDQLDRLHQPPDGASAGS